MHRDPILASLAGGACVRGGVSTQAHPIVCDRSGEAGCCLFRGLQIDYGDAVLRRARTPAAPRPTSSAPKRRAEDVLARRPAAGGAAHAHAASGGCGAERDAAGVIWKA